MTAPTINPARPGCVVCGGWRMPCPACAKATQIIADELMAWNHNQITSGGLGSTLAAFAASNGNGHQHRCIRLTAEEVRIMELFRGPAIPLGERLSARSRAALQ